MTKPAKSKKQNTPAPKEEAAAQANLASSTTINELPPDALAAVFKQLPLADRIAAESVSQKFAAVSKQSAWSDEQVLDIDVIIPTGKEREQPCDELKKIVTDRMTALFERQGKSLKCVDLSRISNYLTPEVIDYFSKTPNVADLTLSGIPVDGALLDKLGDLLPNLRRLVIHETLFGDWEARLTPLFEKCKSLTSLDIAGNEFSKPVETLSALPKTLKHLVLADCWPLDTPEVEQLLATFSSLESLDLSFTTVDDAITADLDPKKESWKSLNSLNLTGCNKVSDTSIERIKVWMDARYNAAYPEGASDPRILKLKLDHSGVKASDKIASPWIAVSSE